MILLRFLLLCFVSSSHHYNKRTFCHDYYEEDDGNHNRGVFVAFANTATTPIVGTNFHGLSTTSVSFVYARPLMTKLRASNLDEDLKTTTAALEPHRWIQKKYNLTDKELTKMQGNTRLLRKGRDRLEPRLDFFASKFNATQTKMKQFVMNPNLRCFDYTVEAMDAKSKQLMSLFQNMTSQELNRMIHNYPRVLSLSIKNNVIPTIDGLQSRTGLTNKQLKRMVVYRSQILCSNLDSNIYPMCHFLEDTFRLNATEGGLSRLLYAAPQVLTQGQDNIETKLRHTEATFQLDGAEVASIFRRAPSLLGLSNDNLDSHFHGLQEELGVDSGVAAKMAYQFPMILVYSTKSNIRPTFQFFCGVLCSEHAARDYVVRYPSFLSYSLKKRLEPRLRQLYEIGFTNATIDRTIVTKMCQKTPAQWNETLEMLKWRA